LIHHNITPVVHNYWSQWLLNLLSHQACLPRLGLTEDSRTKGFNHQFILSLLKQIQEFDK